MIPASTSASRSRIVLAQAGASRDAPRWHAAIMLGVAVTGPWWLHWVPMACLAGGLVLAGLMQVPGLMWSLGYARRSRVTWAQSWLVALVFAVMGGVGALVAGLVVAPSCCCTTRPPRCCAMCGSMASCVRGACAGRARTPGSRPA